MSKYALDCRKYNEELVDITWENCTIRRWLNNDFYNTAFDNEEKQRVENILLENADNDEYHTEGGNNTWDRVFFLSISDIETLKENYDESSQLFNMIRLCGATPYAKSQGVWTLDENSWGGEWKMYATDEGAASMWVGSSFSR